jgi:predicted phosphodiesterase
VAKEDGLEGVMRLAVFSDVHGNLTAFEAAWADYKAQGGADQLWFLGDLAFFGPHPAECIRRVRAISEAAEADDARKGTVRLVRGNTDRYLVTGEAMRSRPAEDAAAFETLRAQASRFQRVHAWTLAQLTFDDYQFLSRLAPECDLAVPGFGHVIGYHGTPGSDEGLLTPETDEEAAADALLDRAGRLAIGGHIHRQMDRALPGGWRAVNVGSVGNAFDRPGCAQWGLFTFGDGDVQVDLRAVPYDIDFAASQFHAVSYPEPAWAEKRLRQP